MPKQGGSWGESAKTAFTFGRFRLIPSRQLLLKDRVPVHLGTRALDILTALVRRSGELVSKSELISAAWPDVFVHESNLKVNVSSLRRALEDTQKNPKYIATVAGRGYRFVAATQMSSEVADEGILTSATESRGFPSQPDIVNREEEIATIRAELQRKPLVTVVGAGGIGKTTVAVASAHAVEADFRDGICFVDLSTFDDPMLLPAALAAAVGVRGNPGDVLAAVVEYLRQRQMLLVMDSCEHVLPSATMFAQRFCADPGESRLLATSREPLGTTVEQVVRLGPLAFPDSDDFLSTEDALRFPALDLFARRTSEWAGRQLFDRDYNAVAQICRSLDGLPLAIELAAAKMEHHTAQQLLTILDEHLGFGMRREGRPTRHETLLATIDWSYRLLSQNEAAILRLVSVFADGFELEDVATTADVVAVHPEDVTTSLGGLVAKSLVVAEVSGEGLRYRLLDSTRRYATERLREDPMAARIQLRYAERILAVFEKSESEWDRWDSREWIARYRFRLADLRAVLSWAFGNGCFPALGRRLTVASLPLWYETSLISEAQARVKRALAHTGRIPSDALIRAKLAIFLGWSMVYGHKMIPEIEEVWLDALACADLAGHVGYQLRALVGFSIYLVEAGRVAEAIKHLQAFQEVSRRHQDVSVGPEGERVLALARIYAGELTKSRKSLDRLAAIHSQPTGGSRMGGYHLDRYIGTRIHLAFAAWLNGDAAYAATTAHDAVAAAERLGHAASLSSALALAAAPVAYLNGDQNALGLYTTQLRSTLLLETIGGGNIPIQKFFAGALADLRGDQNAVDELRAAIDESIDCGRRIRIGWYFSILADALARRERIDEASDAIDMAFRYQTQYGGRWCRPELQRIEASILARAGLHVRVEPLLRDALDEARAMGAGSFELRIARDLADHYIIFDRRSDAIQLLRPVYERFCGDLGTNDLTRASQTLERANADADRGLWPHPPWS